MELNAAHLAADDAGLTSPPMQRTYSEQTLATTINDGTSATTSPDNGSPAAKRSRMHNTRPTARHSTAYVRNYRLSRYRNALRGALPFRLTTMSDIVELPLDTVGCFTTLTFAWIRRYRVLDPPRQRQWRWPFSRSPTSANNAATTAAAANNNHHTAPTANGAAAAAAAGAPANNATTTTTTTTSSSQSQSQQPAPPLVPLLPAADRCEVNAKRLLGLYKYEEQSTGRIGASMARVAWQFCRTRVLLAGMLYTLSHLMAVIALGVFLQLILHAIDAVNPRWSVRVEQGHRFGLFAGLVLALMAQNYLRSAAHSIGLRTAIRLRTACIGAVCSKTLKASVRHPIAAHQIGGLAADESRHLCDMVVLGPALVANLLGLIFCTVAAACSLGAPGIWPMFGIVGILPVGVLCALLSGIFYRRSVSFLGKKLSIVEEYYHSFNLDGYLNVHDSFSKRFAGAISAQYLNLCKSEIFRPAECAQLVTVAVILGGTYLVWCDLQFPTETIAMTALTFMYVLLVPSLVGEWLRAVQALVHGRDVLAKVKQALTLSPPELPKMRPARELKASMTDAIFRWNAAATPAASGTGEPTFELRIDSLAIPKNSLVGVTGMEGSGKTSLVHALLGHLQLCAGEFYQRDKGSLYPEIPYRLDGASIRENIVFHDDWHAGRYREALLLTGLHFNEGTDEQTTVDQVQDLLQLQRIGLARALYSDRDFVVLEEPLSGMDIETDLEAMFVAAVQRLREQGKTVVVVSQNESVLRHCQRIYVLVRGTCTGYADHDEVATLPAYRDCVEQYAEKKRSARYDRHASNLTNAGQGAHNISTEDLVALEEARPAKEDAVATMQPISWCQLLAVGALRLLDGFYATVVPIGYIIYLQPVPLQPFPWAVLNIVIFIPIFLLTGWLTKTLLNRIGRTHNKRIQRALFAKLLGTSLADQRDAHLDQLQHTMIDNQLERFHSCAHIAYCLWVVAICVLMCFFEQSVVFLAVLVPIADCMTRLERYARTVRRYAMLENESRLKLLHFLGNQLKGRVVIQSFDAVQRLRTRLYRTVEENAAAEMILRGTIAYSQHSFQFWQAIILACCTVLLNAYPMVRPIEFGIEVYVYMLTVSHLSQIMTGRFRQMATDQPLRGAQWLLSANSANSADISTLKYDI